MDLVTNIQNEDCELESSEGSEFMDDIGSLDDLSRLKDNKSCTNTNTMSTRSFKSNINSSVNRFARREQRIIQEINSDINYGLNFSSNQLSRRGSFGKSNSNYSKIETTINFRP